MNNFSNDNSDTNQKKNKKTPLKYDNNVDDT